MEKYGNERRTKAYKGGVGEFSQEDLIPNEETIISLTEDGYIKRLLPDTFRSQKRGGKGVVGGNIKDGDAIDKVIAAMTHDNLLLFTDTGKVFQLKAYDIPVSTRTAKGQAIVNFLQISPDEKITSITNISTDDQAKYMLMQTVSGTVKKTPLQDFENVRRSGLIAISLQKGDRLEWVAATSGKDNVILTTAQGQAICFKESQVRPMGRVAAGVRGIKLKGDDRVVNMGVVKENMEKPELLVMTENGYGKRTPTGRYKVQSRGGSGIRTAKITSKTGALISAHIVCQENVEQGDLIVSSNKGQIIRTPIKNIPSLGRDTQGVRIMRLKSGEKLAAATVF